MRFFRRPLFRGPINVLLLCLCNHAHASLADENLLETPDSLAKSGMAMPWTKHTVVARAEGMINSAVADDVDRDGHLDVISSFDGEVTWLRGPEWKRQTLHRFKNSDSRNKPRTSCIHSCLMDVDGDGDLDFCGSNNTVFWLEHPGKPGDGTSPSDATWTYRTIDDEILGTHCLTVADVNADGRPDLIANSGHGKPKTDIEYSLTWLEVPSDPRSDAPWIRHVFADGDAPGGSHYTGAADVNGDGKLDICCAAKGGDAFPRGEWFAWWEQPENARSVWTRHPLADNQPGATNIQPTDLDGDGRVDYAATRGHASGVLWFKNQSNGFEMIEIDPNIQSPHCLACVDLDRDGDIDLATCGKDDGDQAVWYENDGKGKFVRHLIGTSQGSYDLRAVDMDRDGDLDLLIAGHTSNNLVWYENPLQSRN